MLSVGVFLVLLCTFYAKDIHKKFKVFRNNKQNKELKWLDFTL